MRRHLESMFIVLLLGLVAGFADATVNAHESGASAGATEAGAWRLAAATPRTITITNPMVRGYRVDRCLIWGQQCDEPAATAWCRTQGYQRATQWQWVHVRPTLLLGDGMVCNADYCGAFSSVTCTDQGAGAPPLPGSRVIPPHSQPQRPVPPTTAAPAPRSPVAPPVAQVPSRPVPPVALAPPARTAPPLTQGAVSGGAAGSPGKYNCDWGIGDMPGCVGLHYTFRTGDTQFTLDLLNLAANPTARATPQAQQAVLAQLRTGVLDVLLQDDTIVYCAQLVLNGGLGGALCDANNRTRGAGAAGDRMVINAVDNDPQNRLWNCATNRVAFGRDGYDLSRCFSFRYPVPPGGIRGATLHIAFKVLEGSTDALIMALGRPGDVRPPLAQLPGTTAVAPAPSTPAAPPVALAPPSRPPSPPVALAPPSQPAPPPALAPPPRTAPSPLTPGVLAGGPVGSLGMHNCDWGIGDMPGCVGLHYVFRTGDTQFTLDLLNLAADATARATPQAQQAVIAQLRTGVLDMLLQDDTIVYCAQLVLNGGLGGALCDANNRTRGAGAYGDRLTVNAVDNDPQNRLWNCATNRVAFGRDGYDLSRCFSFSYRIPPGGIRTATLHIAFKVLEGSTDALIMAIGRPGGARPPLAQLPGTTAAAPAPSSPAVPPVALAPPSRPAPPPVALAPPSQPVPPPALAPPPAVPPSQAAPPPALAPPPAAPPPQVALAPPPKTPSTPAVSSPEPKADAPSARSPPTGTIPTPPAASRPQGPSPSPPSARGDPPPAVAAAPPTIAPPAGSPRPPPSVATPSPLPGSVAPAAASSPAAAGSDPRVTPTPQAVPAGDKGRGCDGDTRMTSLQARCALEMSVKLARESLALDLDGSNDVTSRDAVIILQRAVGK